MLEYAICVYETALYLLSSRSDNDTNNNNSIKNNKNRNRNNQAFKEGILMVSV